MQPTRHRAVTAVAIGGGLAAVALAAWLLFLRDPASGGPASPPASSTPSAAAGAEPPGVAPPVPPAPVGAGPAGAVVDPAGVPVATATVVRERGEGGGGPRVAEARTDAAGRFAFAAADRGPAQLVAYAGGFLPSAPVDAAAAGPVRLALRAGGTIVGRALDGGDGAPLAAVVVEARATDDAVGRTARGRAGDAPGRFVVGGRRARHLGGCRR